MAKHSASSVERKINRDEAIKIAIKAIEWHEKKMHPDGKIAPRPGFVARTMAKIRGLP